MYENPQVGPDVVDGLEVVAFYDFLEQDLEPGGHAHDGGDVPFGGFLDDFLYLGLPVAFFGNFLAGAVETVEPEGQVPSGDAGKVAGVVSAVVLELGASSQHQGFLFIEFVGEAVFDKGENLPDAGLADGTNHVARYGDVFAGGS